MIAYQTVAHTHPAIMCLQVNDRAHVIQYQGTHLVLQGRVTRCMAREGESAAETLCRAGNSPATEDSKRRLPWLSFIARAAFTSAFLRGSLLVVMCSASLHAIINAECGKCHATRITLDSLTNLWPTCEFPPQENIWSLAVNVSRNLLVTVKASVQQSRTCRCTRSSAAAAASGWHFQGR